jgi:RNA polymerase sigma-70 factor (ECF subfamily)
MVARLETLPVDAAAEAAATTRALFEQHGRMVLAICRSLLRNAAEAEDAAQDTFLSAHRSLLAGRGPRKPCAWLATIARNECRARLRNGQPEVEYVDSDDLGADPAAAATERAVMDELKRAISELPPRQRESVVLRELYGLSPREVAAAMNLATPVVDALLFRARRKLRRQLAPLRGAAGVAVTVQQALREALERAIPGFETSTGVATTTGTVGAGVAGAKLASLPVAAKLAAAAIGVAAVGSAGYHPSGAPAVQPVRAAPAPASAQTIARAGSRARVERSGGNSQVRVEHRSHGAEGAGERGGGHSGPGRGGLTSAAPESRSDSHSGPSGGSSEGSSGPGSGPADGSSSSGRGSGESPATFSSGPGSGEIPTSHPESEESGSAKDSD